MMTQRIRLEQEGIVFRRGRVVMSRFRWQNGAAARHAATVGPRRSRRGFDPERLACG